MSNYTPSQTAALVAHLSIPARELCNRSSRRWRSSRSTDGTLDLAMQHGIGVLAWSPLAGGRLGTPGDDERAQRVCAELDVQAQRCGVSRSAAAYAWIMAHPAGVIPIVGSQQASRIREAADAYQVGGPEPTGTGCWSPREARAALSVCEKKAPPLQRAGPQARIAARGSLKRSVQ